MTRRPRSPPIPQSRARRLRRTGIGLVKSEWGPAEILLQCLATSGRIQRSPSRRNTGCAEVARTSVVPYRVIVRHRHYTKRGKRHSAAHETFDLAVQLSPLERLAAGCETE